MAGVDNIVGGSTEWSSGLCSGMRQLSLNQCVVQMI
jgi:hypothetical protein|eukprot:COSAG02_NODE_822_length_16778_cov_4.476168_4_plen_36_part_00